MYYISHPTGNQNSRSAANALYRLKNESCFFTSLNTTKIANCIGKLSPNIKKKLSRRSYDDVLMNVVQLAPVNELMRLVGVGGVSVDSIYKLVDNRLARRIEVCNEVIDGVYAYEDGAFNTFLAAKAKKIKCIYELPIGYWKEGRRLARQEIKINEPWGCTWRAEKDGIIKLQQKDDELNLADHIIVASNYTKKTLIDNFDGDLTNKISVVPYGFPKPVSIDKRKWHKRGEKVKVLFVGGLNQRKGLSYLTEGVREFLEKNYISLSVIGVGPAENIMRNSLTKANFMGSISHQDVIHQMRNHDILLFPSLFEGFGLVVTEAMSQGMAVIATDRTCLSDVADNESGVCIDAASSVAIKKSIEYFLDNPDMISHIGGNAICKAKIESWSSYEEKMMNKITSFGIK